ncbi:WD40-repeat-containing domain protein [Phlyctochytrium arcticum]|nr:WD40-repeat-containing domain protein [Phlyctochytrium arcticum]
MPARCFCFFKRRRNRRKTNPTLDGRSTSKENSASITDNPSWTGFVGNDENPLDIEKELPLRLDSQSWLDEFREKANLGFLRFIEGPVSHVPETPTIPDVDMEKEHIYGYSTSTQRSNFMYLSPPSSNPSPITIYPAGNFVVVTQIPNASKPSPNPSSLFVEHAKTVTALCVHPDGGIAASAESGPNACVKVWTLKNPTTVTGRLGRTPNLRMPTVMQLDENVQVLVLATIQLPKDTLHVPSLAFSKDGAFLIVVGNQKFDAEVRIYDWKGTDGSGTGSPTALAQGVCQNQLFTIITHPWSRRDFVTVGINYVTFWTIDVAILGSGVSLSRKEGVIKEDGPVTMGFKANVNYALQPTPTLLCAMYTKHRMLVTGSLNGDIMFWRTGIVEVTLKRIHKGPVFCLSPLPGPAHSFLSGGEDGRILLWNDFLQPVSEIAFDDPSPIRSLDAGGCGGLWYGWRGNDLRRRASRALRLSGSTSMYLSPMKSMSGSLSQTLSDGSGPATAVKVLVGRGDGSQWEVAVSNDVTAIKTLFREAPSTQNGGQHWGLAAHPSDPNVFLSGGDDGILRLWDASKHLLTRRRNLQTKLRCCTWSPDARQVAVGTDDGVVHVLTPDIQGTINVIRQRRDTIHEVSYSPNGKFLAVASQEGVIDIYNVENAEAGEYQRIMCCKGHSSFVASVDWSSDSHRLQSNSGNSEVMFWTMSSQPANLSTTPFSEVDWATNNCSLTWSTKGVYGNGDELLKDKLADRKNRRSWLNKVLNNSDYRSDLFRFAGSVLGLREVTACTKSTPPSSTPLLLLGTNRGDIHLFAYPACSEKSPALTWTSHTGPVGRVVFSCDGMRAVSIGAHDGCIIQYKTIPGVVSLRTRVAGDMWNMDASSIP